MPKDAREIYGTVRLSKKGNFTPDMVDELEEAASPEEIERLTEKGLISGFAPKPAKAATGKSEKVEKSGKTDKTEQ